ncbi:MAG: ATP-binding protein [Stellaceae bacterium]
MLPPTPSNQAARLEALRRYGILDTPPEPEFDEITELIARVCETPIAVINFIDDGRQWFKSAIGLGIRETPLDVSICAHAILQPGLFVVHDTLNDDRFSSNPLVTGDPWLRFYAGALLETSEHHPLGTLCVLDYKPRALSEVQLAVLQTLARQVMTQLELRRANAVLSVGIVQTLAERHDAEDALHRVQKMETVGHLTGGIAHDFNNLLGVIIGSLENAERRLGEQNPVVMRGIARAIRSAERAAILTRRLLAFSRHHDIDPRILDLNAVVSEMVDLLRHTLGAQITIEANLSSELWPIRVDENQLENALLNLAINARDAMPRGGILTIKTANATLDESFVGQEIEFRPGQYVMLSVTDTGGGMTPEVVQRIFEPFFTTKGADGTGLGLGMVYGFVKRAEGHVQVRSEPGKGSTLTLYLPRLIEEQ